MRTDLQLRVSRVLARNRSELSYCAGGLVLNADWPRFSDDLDIFQDRDEDIPDTASADIGLLRESGLDVEVRLEVHGCVEAVAGDGREVTSIQWMSESRTRFFPIVRDRDWGARLDMADLAVNKVVAASTRRVPRDAVDAVSISERFAPLGPLFMAAAAKLSLSPARMVDECRQRLVSFQEEDIASVRCHEETWTRARLQATGLAALDAAAAYIAAHPWHSPGVLPVDGNRRPVPLERDRPAGAVELRRATPGGGPFPEIGDDALSWSG